jgi:hypothetical protein
MGAGGYVERSNDDAERKREELREEIDRRLIALDARIRNGQASDERGEGALCSTLRSLLDALDGLEKIRGRGTDPAE